MSVYPYKLQSGKELWRYDVQHNERRYTKKGFKNKTEAKKAKSELLGKFNNNEVVVSSKLDLATYLNNWIKEA